MTAVARISLNGAPDLIASVPNLLGFVPARSVVMLHFANKRLGLTARVDLDAPAEAAVEVQKVAGPFTRAVIVAYADDEVSGCDALDRLAVHYADPEVFIVVGNRFRHACTCCPQTWQDIPATNIPWESLSGTTVALSREAMVAKFRPSAASTIGLPDDTPPLDKAIEAWRQVLSGEPFLPDETISIAALAVQSKGFRDRLIGTLRPQCSVADDGGLPGLDIESSATQPDLIADMVRRLPPALAAPALVVAATCLWADGNGAAASEAVASALRCDHTDRLALLLATAIENGIRITTEEN